MDVGQAKCHGDITKGPKTRHVNTGQIASFKWLYMACMRLTMSSLQAVLGLASPELAERVT